MMSFNASETRRTSGAGASLKWYGELAADDTQVMTGLVNTLIVAAGATVLSTVLGTLLAVGLASATSRSRLLDAFAVAAGDPAGHRDGDRAAGPVLR